MGANIGGRGVENTPRKLHPRALAALNCPPTPSTEGPYTPLNTPTNSSPEVTPTKVNISMDLIFSDSDSDYDSDEDKMPFNISFCKISTVLYLAKQAGQFGVGIGLNEVECEILRRKCADHKRSAKPLPQIL